MICSTCNLPIRHSSATAALKNNQFDIFRFYKDKIFRFGNEPMSLQEMICQFKPRVSPCLYALDYIDMKNFRVYMIYNLLVMLWTHGKIINDSWMYNKPSILRGYLGENGLLQSQKYFYNEKPGDAPLVFVSMWDTTPWIQAPSNNIVLRRKYDHSPNGNIGWFEEFSAIPNVHNSFEQRLIDAYKEFDTLSNRLEYIEIIREYYNR